MSDLIEQLRRLARYNHDDLSIGTDAADRIEQLERELAAAKERIWQLADAAFTQNAAREKAESRVAELEDLLKGDTRPVRVRRVERIPFAHDED